MSPTTDPALSPEEPVAIDFRVFASRVWAHRVQVIGSVVVAGLLSVILAMVLPKWYRSTAVILPPEETDLAANLGVMGRALSKFPALGEFGEYSTPADIYKAILNSQTVHGDVVDGFGLMKVYGLRSRELTMRKFDHHCSVKLLPDGTISISVEDHDRQRAADMALAMIRALDHYNIEKRNTQGRRTRVFLERRVHETDSLMHASEDGLRRYLESHRTVAPSTSGAGDVSAAADLMARKISLEVRIGVMRGYLRDDNEQVIQATRELSELERQIGTLPGLQTELARLIRDTKVQEQLYLLLTAELEDARLQELRDTPTVSILDPARPAERQSRPRKLVFGLVAAILSGVSTSLLFGLRREPDRPASS